MFIEPLEDRQLLSATGTTVTGRITGIASDPSSATPSASGDIAMSPSDQTSSTSNPFFIAKSVDIAQTKLY